MNRRTHGAMLRLLAGAAVTLSGVSPPLRADELTVNGHRHSAARIVAYQSGRLEYRTSGGDARQADITALDFLHVERGEAFADFNRAERYAAQGEWSNALLRYKRAARLSEGFWIDLVAARMLRAADHAKRIDESAAAYLHVLHAEFSGPAVAIALFPGRLPTTRDAAATRALQQLSDAAAADPLPPQKLAIDLLGYEILRSLRDPLAAQVAVRLTEAPVPATLRTARVYASMRTALEQRLSSSVSPSALSALDRAMVDCPAEMLPDFLLLKGRTLFRRASSREEFIRASWPFLRVVVHMPDDPRAAEGLLGAARCLERLNRRDKAAELLRECLAHRRVSEAVAREARDELQRWGSS